MVEEEKKDYEALVRTTLHLWDSLGIDVDRVIKILGKGFNNNKALNIFITDVKTEYDENCYYAGYEETRTNVVTGYKVGFVLNEEIACEIRVGAKHCNGCKEQIRNYIRDKIRGVK